MDILKRFGVSIEKNLLDKFDSYVRKRGYENRSEALRDLIRKELVDSRWSDNANEKVAGAIIIIYDHHRRELLDDIINIQHDYHKVIISSQHVHLDHDTCLEVIVVKGKIAELFELETKLKVIKGVKHALLAKSTLGKEI
ncbi:MAG: nickel-responsive regulator [Actinobacteria bacterium RBG_19FT_COMBO_36_27]|nr:MAG: nickel-responsive regulator [Actinobacteria bacterium RBG_19FT_COMBO_36_27]